MLVSPPIDGSRNPITVNGRAYSCVVGQTITVPDQDGFLMRANGWVQIAYTPSFGSFEAVDKLLKMFAKARDNNPYSLPVMPSPPTVTVSTTTDATLGPVQAFASNGVMTSFGLNNVAWMGGAPVPKSADVFVMQPVSSSAPSTGNLVGYAGAGITSDMNQWNAGIEIMDDGATVEFSAYVPETTRKIMFQVDGQYVDKAGTSVASAGTNYFKLAFGSTKDRRIRMLTSCAQGGNGPTLLIGLRSSPLASVWKPDQSDVLTCKVFGDSYAEGTPLAYGVPNATWCSLMCELLGIRNCLQHAVGTTGYLNDGAGRSRLRVQIAQSITQQGPAPDIIVVAHGYNDYTATPSALTVEVAYCLGLLRALYPNVPIVVFGAQAGARGPDTQTIGIENAIAAGVAAFNDPLCKFAPYSTATPAFLNGTGYVGATNSSGNSDILIGPDATHPTSPLGHQHLGYRQADGVRTAIRSMMA